MFMNEYSETVLSLRILLIFLPSLRCRNFNDHKKSKIGFICQLSTFIGL